MSDNPLATLSNVKAIAGISSSSTKYDATMTMLLNRVSEIVRRYLSRELTRSTYDEVLAPTNRQLLLLKEWPIVSVTSVSVNGAAITQGTSYRLDTQDAARGQLYKEDGWQPINLISGLAGDVVAAARSVEVVYIAGYYLPGDDNYVEGDPASLPIEISGVCEELVAIRFQKVKAQAHGLTAYSEGGISYSWKQGTNQTEFGIPDEQASVLNAYKRFVVA